MLTVTEVIRIDVTIKKKKKNSNSKKYGCGILKAYVCRLYRIMNVSSVDPVE